MMLNTANNPCPHSGPPLVRHDLCAKMHTLDSYGLPGISVALAEGVAALVGASKSALHAVGRRAVSAGDR